MNRIKGENGIIIITSYMYKNWTASENLGEIWKQKKKREMIGDTIIKAWRFGCWIIEKEERENESPLAKRLNFAKVGRKRREKNINVQKWRREIKIDEIFAPPLLTIVTDIVER